MQESSQVIIVIVIIIIITIIPYLKGTYCEQLWYLPCLITQKLWERTTAAICYGSFVVRQRSHA